MAKSYAAQIAADVRTAIRTLKDAGQLNALPKGARVTVRSASASMLSEVFITIAGVTDVWAWEGGTPDVSPRKMTPAAAKVVNRLKEAGAKAANGRGWGEVQIAYGEHRITVGGGWTPAGWRPGQD